MDKTREGNREMKRISTAVFVLIFVLVIAPIILIATAGHVMVDADSLGHVHHGAPEGRSSAQVSVYNVSMPLLKRRFPDRPPFRVLELDREESPSTNGHVPRGEAITDRIGAAATA